MIAPPHRSTQPPIRPTTPPPPPTHPTLYPATHPPHHSTLPPTHPTLQPATHPALHLSTGQNKKEGRVNLSVIDTPLKQAFTHVSRLLLRHASPHGSPQRSTQGEANGFDHTTDQATDQTAGLGANINDAVAATGLLVVLAGVKTRLAGTVPIHECVRD